jgi:RNA polymerase sigma factor (sigma-70 family)
MSQLTEGSNPLASCTPCETGSAELAGGPAPTWEAMVEDHYMYVYRRCLMLAGNTRDAEDLTQDTFVNVFRSWTTYQPGNVEAWLSRIATNLFINLVRRRNRAKTYPLFDTEIPLPSQAVPTVVELVTDQILDADVAAALEEVPPAFRTVVLLNDVAGVPRPQIAQLLGLNPSTVGTRLFAAAEQLRKSLAHRRPAPRGTDRSARPQR